MNWLEVSLEVNGEMAEAVADVLARDVPGGVVVESTAITPELEGPGQPVGPLRVCGYLPVDDRLEETRQRIAEGLYFLGRIQPLPTPQFTPVQAIDWAEAWKENFRPVKVGQRLLIIPSWLSPPQSHPVEGKQREARIPIRIDPGMAFGTGTHPTTQLCLEMLETLVPEALGCHSEPQNGEESRGWIKNMTPRQTSGEVLQIASEQNGLDVFDIGCGSGILSIAALKLGAARAYGVDTEPEAITNAEENARLNGVDARIQVVRGSAADIRNGVFPITQAPLVVANILAHILIKLLDAGMRDLVAPGGKLLLSGILEEQMPKLRAALEKHNLQIAAQRQIEDWVAITVTR